MPPSSGNSDLSNYLVKSKSVATLINNHSSFYLFTQLNGLRLLALAYKMQTCSDFICCIYKYVGLAQNLKALTDGHVCHVRHYHLIADISSNVFECVFSQLGSMETPDMFFIHETPLAGSVASEKMRNFSTFLFYLFI